MCIEERHSEGGRVAIESAQESKVAKRAKAALPSRKGIAWWLVLIEGMVFLGVGLYMVIATEDTSDLLGKILAATLGVMGLAELIAALRVRSESGKIARWTAIQGRHKPLKVDAPCHRRRARGLFGRRAHLDQDGRS